MKFIKHVKKAWIALATVVAVGASHQALAAEPTVYTVAQLTNAVATATAGAVIVLAPGTYTLNDEYMLDNGTTGKSFLNVDANNVTIMGATESSRKDWTYQAEPVIIDCANKARLVNSAYNAYQLTIKNIAVTGCSTTYNYGTIGLSETFNRFVTFTNCVFRNNTQKDKEVFWNHNYFTLRDCAFVANSGKLDGTFYGCDIYGNTGYMTYVHGMYDCSVEGHVRTDANPVVSLSGDAIVSNCTFKANAAAGNDNTSTRTILKPAKKATIKGCTFESNTNTLIVADLDDTDASLINIAKCTFVSNTVTVGARLPYGGLWLGYLILNNTNNFASAAAAQARFSVSDSTFDGNCYGTHQWNLCGMTDVFGVHAIRCTFGGHSADTYYAIDHYNMSALNSSLEDCDIMGGDITDCVVNRCTIHDVTNRMCACFRDYCRVTNSLVSNFSPANQAFLYASLFKQDAEFVNCTFATNSAVTYRSNLSSDVCDDVKFINCLFNSNTNGSGKETDFSMKKDSDTTLNCWLSKVSFDHCFYGRFTPDGDLTDERFAAKTNGVDTLTFCANPKFVKDSRPDAPYWSLLPNSQLIGKGDASIWTAEDVDLTGKFRLRDGKVDIGCYECWLREPGMMIFVR